MNIKIKIVNSLMILLIAFTLKGSANDEDVLSHSQNVVSKSSDGLFSRAVSSCQQVLGTALARISFLVVRSRFEDASFRLLKSTLDSIVMASIHNGEYISDRFSHPNLKQSDVAEVLISPLGYFLPISINSSAIALDCVPYGGLYGIVEGVFDRLHSVGINDDRRDIIKNGICESYKNSEAAQDRFILLEQIKSLSDPITFDCTLTSDLIDHKLHLAACRLIFYPNGELSVQINDSLDFWDAYYYRPNFETIVKRIFESLLGFKIKSYDYRSIGYQLLNWGDCELFSHANAISLALQDRLPTIPEIAHFFWKIESRKGFGAHGLWFFMARCDQAAKLYGSPGVFGQLTYESQKQSH
jgi:hypothetical protein